jgi:segregation and condensation protein B
MSQDSPLSRLASGLERAMFGPARSTYRTLVTVLSLVAYKQPITRETIERLYGNRPHSLLNQLLRRDLIALQRDGEKSEQVTYRTTPRFLQVFGISSLDELPQAEDLYFK